MSNYNSTLQSNNTDLQAILNTINELPEASGEQATPVISINSSNGLITATAGAKTSTHQLAFQPAKTIRPSTTNQIAVSSGYYTGGNITVKGDSNLVPSNIVSGKSIFGVVGTATTGVNDPFASSAPFTYTVNAISGASYGFAKNSSGYYESQNKGQNSTYAICRVNFNVTSACDIVFDVINYAESSYDYALFGNLDSALSLSSSADSSVKKSFKGEQSASVVNVTYSGVTVGSHYIDIKFIKDTSQHKNNDSVQFKVQEQGSLPQETISKILAADGDLIAENIKSGVDIFGVVGTYAGSGGGDTNVEDGFVTRTLTSYTNNRVTSIGSSAFYYFINLKTINFPAVTTIGKEAFRGCTTLTTANFPNAKSINMSAFSYCTKLATISFPLAENISTMAFCNCTTLASVYFPKALTIGNSAFGYCTKLTTVSLPAAQNIESRAFIQCSNLKSLYLSGSSVCFLYDSNAFSYTPIGGSSATAGTYGSIYVPTSLLTSYKRATNWTYFSSRFVGI